MVFWIEIAGLIVIAAAVLIPLAMDAPMLCGIFKTWREERVARRHRVTCLVPGLGEFTSVGDDLWFGEVRGLSVTLTHADGPTNHEQIVLVQKLLADLPRLVEEGGRYVVAHEDKEWFGGIVRSFEAFGLELEDDSTFVLELTNPADIDGVYRVEFQSGVPVNSSRDD
jgi:hypothetical protein